MASKYLKIICVVISLIMLVSIAMPITMAESDDTDGARRSIDVLKDVYKVPNNPNKPDKPDKPEKPPGGGGKPPKPPVVDKWAVVIGIADYRGTDNDLQYTDDDALDMYDYLISKDYPEDNIKLLLNAKASARNIAKAIGWMDDRETKSTSECVFFYSGHGSTYNGYDDGDPEVVDEGIVSADLYLILDGQLRSMFAGFDSQKIAFIFDSCFSGGMDDLAGDGRVVVTACAEGEYSWDGTSEMENGVFTYHYMAGLYSLDTIECAFTYAAPLATADVLTLYGATMDPQIFDHYTGDWAF
jgi:hypothetical protein